MITVRPATATAAKAFWIDLFEPDDSDRTKVETGCGLKLPTRADLQEIESSSRHYMDRGRVFLSTPFMTLDPEAGVSVLTPVGFALDQDRVITQRFGHAELFSKLGTSLDTRSDLRGCEAFCIIIEAMVDHAADHLEGISGELDQISRIIFHRSDPARRKSAETDLEVTLSKVGYLGERIGQVRGAILGLGRIIPYVVETVKDWLSEDQIARFRVARQDLSSLIDYESHLANKVQFLLDAVLGFINIDQNNVVKILTIVSVVGVPPVLIAGIYGMNFKGIPELDWKYGYAYALALMLVTTLAPLVWFRWKKWF
jgi:magnesium transporter